MSRHTLGYEANRPTVAIQYWLEGGRQPQNEQQQLVDCTVPTVWYGTAEAPTGHLCILFILLLAYSSLLFASFITNSLTMVRVVDEDSILVG